MNKEKIIEEMFDRGVLLSEDILDKLDKGLLDKIDVEQDLLVLNEDYANILSTQSSLVDWYEVDTYRVGSEKDRNDELYQAHLQGICEQHTLHASDVAEFKEEVSPLESTLDGDEYSHDLGTGEERDLISGGKVDELNVAELADTELNTRLEMKRKAVEIKVSFENKPRKYVVRDFAQFFLSRYRFLEKILRNRSELSSTMTIARAVEKRDREQISIIGLVEDIAETKNGNLLITLEDPTGKIKVLFSKSKKDLFARAKDLVFDEVIGICGVASDKIIFADSISWPDIPISRELKKGPKDEYIIFLSDLHVGSKLFLEEEFVKFVKWLRGEVGSEKQRSIANKVKYIVIAGDLVDGIGIYPGQQEELAIDDMKGQYDEFCRLIREVPKDKQIIICPGNHDAVHLAEPQPIFYQQFTSGLIELENVTLVTNPGVVVVGKEEGFAGFEILLYHGYSFDYYVANVESIRNGGGYHRADLIMKFLLQRRHLAPSFKSTPYYPSHSEDPLLIKTIPDFFVTGHIHYSSVANYKGITMISGSCWQAKTNFQEKLGHEPEPGRVPVVNLKTREIRILKFI